MKKNIVQDVIPPKKSIRNIKLPAKSRIQTEEETSFERPAAINREHVREHVKIERRTEVVSEDTNLEENDAKAMAIPPYKYEYKEPKKSGKKFLYISLALFILVLTFAVSALFKSAKITVTPKQDSRQLDATLSAKKDALVGGLGFQVVTVTKEAEKSVTATGEQNVSTKATGKIIIYNNFSKEPQKLVATTRFETPEGLIFRLVEAATVPGQQVKDGKTVAGSLEVTVEADKPGTTYNITFKDFTIPGFKGDPKYTKVYGRSKTEMSGGYSGLQKVVSPENLKEAGKDLESQLASILSKDIVSQIPENFVLYPNSIVYKYDNAAQVAPSGAAASSSSAVIKEKGTATAIIFDKTTLTKLILMKVSPDIGDNIVKIVDVDQLDFAYDKKEVFDPATGTEVTFTLKGPTNIVWIYEANKLKTDLLGLSKTNARAIIGNYGSIKEAWVETRPFWNQTIPSNPKKVTIVDTLTR